MTTRLKQKRTLFIILIAFACTFVILSYGFICGGDEELGQIILPNIDESITEDEAIAIQESIGSFNEIKSLGTFKFSCDPTTYRVDCICVNKEKCTEDEIIQAEEDANKSIQNYCTPHKVLTKLFQKRFKAEQKLLTEDDYLSDYEVKNEGQLIKTERASNDITIGPIDKNGEFSLASSLRITFFDEETGKTYYADKFDISTGSFNEDFSFLTSIHRTTESYGESLINIYAFCNYELHYSAEKVENE